MFIYIIQKFIILVIFSSNHLNFQYYYLLYQSYILITMFLPKSLFQFPIHYLHAKLLYFRILDSFISFILFDLEIFSINIFIILFIIC